METFHDIHKNPVKSDVYKGTEVFDEGRHDSIIGIGGGAALDVARAIALRVNHREDLFKYDDLKGGDIYVTNDVPHFITIPTTAGTGSEVGRSAIISDDETHQKKILFSPKLLARIVFADPLLTMDLPPFITAATGMDALTHNMEAFLVNMFHPMCDGIALQGISLIHAIPGKSGKSAGPGIQEPDADCIFDGSRCISERDWVLCIHWPIRFHHCWIRTMDWPMQLIFPMEWNLIWKDLNISSSRLRGHSNLKEETGEAVVDILFELNDKINIPTKTQCYRR